MIDGRKNNKGVAKKAEDKKKPVTIYRTAAEIKKIGGVSVAREILNTHFDVIVKHS